MTPITNKDKTLKRLLCEVSFLLTKIKLYDMIKIKIVLTKKLDKFQIMYYNLFEVRLQGCDNFEKIKFVRTTI